MTDATRCGDIQVWRGENDPPVEWRFLNVVLAEGAEPTPDQLFDLTGSELYLEIKRGSTIFVSRNTADDPDFFSFDIATAVATWTPTLPETRALPLGRIAQYLIERRIDGRQGKLVIGSVNVCEGPNSD